MAEKKITRKIIITLIGVVIIVLFFVVFYFKQIKNENKIDIEGRWNLLAARYMDIYISDTMSDSEYLDFKSDGSLDYMLEKEIKGAKWEFNDDIILIKSDTEEKKLIIDDRVIEYEEDDYTLFFVREGSKSEKIDYIKSMIADNLNNEMNQKKKKIDEYTDENLDQIYGQWVLFAEEYIDDNKPPQILEDSKNKSTINFYEDGKLEIDNQGEQTIGTWTLNKELKILNANIDGQDALVFTVDKVIILISSQGNSYYSREGQNSEKKEKIIESLKEYKQED